MDVKPGPEVFDVAKRIPGLSGVELQMHFKGTTLWDRETLEGYKSGAKNAGIEIPSLAGVWTHGVSILQTGPAEEQLRKAIQAAETIGARVILVAFFKQNCPNMEDEASYGPVVTLLQKVAPMAAAAGVTLGLEDLAQPRARRETRRPGEAAGGQGLFRRLQLRVLRPQGRGRARV